MDPLDFNILGLSQEKPVDDNIDYTNLKNIDLTNLSKLKIFFNYIIESDEEYNICSYDGMYYSLKEDPVDFKHAILFDKNIKEIYFLNLEWKLDIFYNRCAVIGKLNNNHYFYFTSKFNEKNGFNKTGFGCGMCLILSTKLEILIKRGIEILDKIEFYKQQNSKNIK
jgi:hypothetical protein